MTASAHTIIAPLPNDPRVMSLSKSCGLTRREAFGAAAEAWAWLDAHAVDGLVVKAAPDSLDGLVEVPGFGQAMIQAGLVGVVDDGLVLPAELRQERHAGRRGGDADEDDQEQRRKALNAESARRYRKKKKLTGSKTKTDTGKPRSLGYVAGHEVRVFDGQYGPYAMLLGATVGGEPYKKLTTGDKTWSVDTVTLADALPGLLQKWRTIHEREQKIFVASKRKILSPSYDALRAAAARHADGDDASCRHADASSFASSSSGNHAGDKSRSGKGLDAGGASSARHDDAVSSMSSISSSSLSSLEEKREEEEREIKRRYEALCGHAMPNGPARSLRPGRMLNTPASRFAQLCREAQERWSVIEYVDGKETRRPTVSAIAEELGMTEDEVRRIGLQAAWSQMRRRILDALEAERDKIIAEASSKPADARDDIAVTTEPDEGDKPATGDADAPGDDEPHDDLDGLTSEPTAGGSVTTREALEDLGIPTPTLRRPPDAGRRVDVFRDEPGRMEAVLLRPAS